MAHSLRPVRVRVRPSENTFTSSEPLINDAVKKHSLGWKRQRRTDGGKKSCGGLWGQLCLLFSWRTRRIVKVRKGNKNSVTGDALLSFSLLGLSFRQAMMGTWWGSYTGSSFSLSIRQLLKSWPAASRVAPSAPHQLWTVFFSPRIFSARPFMADFPPYRKDKKSIHG